MKYQFTPKSSNVKTGPIPTTMTERKSCPLTCPLRENGCYADNFPLSLHWDRVAEKGINLDALLEKIKALPKGQLWRHNVAGDFPHINGKIERQAFWDFVMASGHTNPIIYSHHKLNPNNKLMFRLARNNGVNINASCESVTDAIKAIDSGINAVFVGRENTQTHKVGDTTIVTCPAQLREDVTCSSCGLCARDRVGQRVAIQFIPHGTKAKKVELCLK